MSGLVIHGTANGCARCGEQFGSVVAFDWHQDVDYDREPAVVCRDPAWLRLTRDGNGVWRRPPSPDWQRRHPDASVRLSGRPQSAEHSLPSGSVPPAPENVSASAPGTVQRHT
jgi:hypothetical protein